MIDAESYDSLAPGTGIGSDGAGGPKYTVEKMLGQGGFGITYFATWHPFRSAVAIKELFPGDLVVRARTGNDVVVRRPADAELFARARLRFEQECRVLASLRHENIVRVLDFLSQNKTAYLVMEYVEGDSLRNLLRRTGCFDAEQAWQILAQVLMALRALHSRGLIHRDIKPQNILVREDGRPVLVDFGAARQLGAMGVSQQIVATGYSPLEQYAASGRLGPWTDLYALGACLHECLTGAPPPDAFERKAALDAGLPDPLRPLPDRSGERPLGTAINAMLRVAADARAQSVDEVLKLCEAPAMSVPRDAPPLVSPPPVERRARRRWWWAGTAAVLVLAAIVFGAMGRRNVPANDAVSDAETLPPEPPAASIVHPVRFNVDPQVAQIAVDGEPVTDGVMYAMPGMRRIRLSAPGFRSFETQVRVDGASRVSVALCPLTSTERRCTTHAGPPVQNTTWTSLGTRSGLYDGVCPTPGCANSLMDELESRASTFAGQLCAGAGSGAQRRGRFEMQTSCEVLRIQGNERGSRCQVLVTAPCARPSVTESAGAEQQSCEDVVVEQPCPDGAARFVVFAD